MREVWDAKWGKCLMLARRQPLLHRRMSAEGPASCLPGLLFPFLTPETLVAPPGPGPVTHLHLPSCSCREDFNQFLVQRDRPGENGLPGTPAGGPQAPESHAAPALYGGCGESELQAALLVHGARGGGGGRDRSMAGTQLTLECLTLKEM